MIIPTQHLKHIDIDDIGDKKNPSFSEFPDLKGQ